jgi:hypothetical protein
MSEAIWTVAAALYSRLTLCCPHISKLFARGKTVSQTSIPIAQKMGTNRCENSSTRQVLLL